MNDWVNRHCFPSSNVLHIDKKLQLSSSLYAMIAINVAYNHFSWVTDGTDCEKWELVLTVEQRVFQHPCLQLIKSSLLVPVDNYKGFTSDSITLKYRKHHQGQMSVTCFEHNRCKVDAQLPQISSTGFLITDIIRTVMMWPLLSSELQAANSRVSTSALQAWCLPCCCSFIPLSHTQERPLSLCRCWWELGNQCAQTGIRGTWFWITQGVLVCIIH